MYQLFKFTIKRIYLLTGIILLLLMISLIALIEDLEEIVHQFSVIEHNRHVLIQYADEFEDSSHILTSFAL